LADADAVWERYARDDGGDAFREALRRCVDALPEDERQALFRRYRDGLSLEAAAPALGLSAEGLKTRLRRLKERLKECVEQRIRREEA
jgi:RNA polymerase sigma factor (sigma-70 family)